MAESQGTTRRIRWSRGQQIGSWIIGGVGAGLWVYQKLAQPLWGLTVDFTPLPQVSWFIAAYVLFGLNIGRIIGAVAGAMSGAFGTNGDEEKAP